MAGQKIRGPSCSSSPTPSACDQYTEQAEAFAQAVLGEAPLPYGVEDAIRTMRVIDAIFESEKTGAWASVKR